MKSTRIGVRDHRQRCLQRKKLVLNRSHKELMPHRARFAPCLFVLLSMAAVAQTEQPLKVTACQLKQNPATYNHKLIVVTAFVSHGFEDFSLFDPECLPWMNIWLEYGGKAKSGTMYCCGVTASRSRPKPLRVEGVAVPVLQDENFVRFDELVQKPPDRLVHAVLIGRFFAGKPHRLPDGRLWGAGYGHMGCCSLFVIQQVLSVDSQNVDDIDYRAFYEQPDIKEVGCGYRNLIAFEPFVGIPEEQRKADASGPEWLFEDPYRVATQELARLTRLDESSIRLKETRTTQGHRVYEWSLSNAKKSYMVVVSRPYLATFYARDPKRIAWKVIAAFEAGCGSENSVERVR